MLVPQAIFTSVRSGRNEGYQLAAVSSGVSSEQERELSQWGPGHDSLYELPPGTPCASFHPLQSGGFCLSLSMLSGREYSGRAGQRVYTRSYLLSAETLERFANHPFRVMEALVAGGHVDVLDPVPRQLDAIPLIGRASPVNVDDLERVCQTFPPEQLSCLVNAALTGTPLGIVGGAAPHRLLRALLDLLPLPRRPECSLTTGLKPSQRRPFRWTVLPPDREHQREAARLLKLTVFRLDEPIPTQFAPRAGWALLVLDLLRNRQYDRLAPLVQNTKDLSDRDFDWLAEQTREGWDRVSSALPLPPFVPSSRETVGTGSGCRADRQRLLGGIAH